MEELLIIKTGGNVIDDAEQLAAFVRDFAGLPGNKILVHGGGKIATETGRRLGIIPQYHKGRRITDEATLELVTMVYGGLINKKIVAQLQSCGANAIGLSGCDGNVITAVKRPVREVDFGFVGDVLQSGVHTAVLAGLLQSGLVPVLSPLTHDGAGSMLNTNADTIAQAVAGAFADTWQVTLVYCFEKAGVLRDPADDTSVITFITRPDFDRMAADGMVSEGMIPKLDNAFHAIDRGVKKVIIGSAAHLTALITGKSGTHIQ